MLPDLCFDEHFVKPFFSCYLCFCQFTSRASRASHRGNIFSLLFLCMTFTRRYVYYYNYSYLGYYLYHHLLNTQQQRFFSPVGFFFCLLDSVSLYFMYTITFVKSKDAVTYNKINKYA
ncbi:hypothetical protein BDC45DRAFT_513210 [Circinella umbellata]|nr:hypothetical protein BDC45DRAFT_513210 [Circinella umbellata]